MTLGIFSLDRDLAPILGDLSLSEKNSEIKPPLVLHSFILVSWHFLIYWSPKSVFSDCITVFYYIFRLVTKQSFISTTIWPFKFIFIAQIEE